MLFLCKKWCKTFQQKILQTTCSWDFRQLQEGLPPTARWIRSVTPRIWIPQHNQYWSNSQSNFPRTLIQPPGTLLFLDPFHNKTPQSIALEPYQYDWVCNWTLWHLQKKLCPDKLFFGNFNDQLIPSNYYNVLNNDNEDGNNILDTPVDNALPDN